MVIDAQYTAGFSWARQYGLRLSKNFNNKVWFAVSMENPQATVTTHGNANNFLVGSAGAGGGLYNSGITNMVVDLANLTFVDSVGLSVFITAAKRVRAANGTLTVRNANRPVKRALEITGLMGSASSDEDDAMVAEAGEPTLTATDGAA